MIDVCAFGDELKIFGFSFFAGVPCSFLNPLINYAVNDCDFIMAASETDAVATAAGAYIGGRKSVVLMQNSGLANAVSALTSLTFCFRIPLLGFVSLRGESGINDEPQHELMGLITTDLLDCMKIKWSYLEDDSDKAKKQIAQANEIIEQGESFFFVVKKNTFGKIPLKDKSVKCTTNKSKCGDFNSDQTKMPSRFESLQTLRSTLGEDAIYLATTGFTGRELHELKDAPNNLYMVGSMGCISSLALGLAISKPSEKIVAIDGDGALVMRMGNMAVNGFYAPKNMLHVLLDNNCHDSTGGQFCTSCNVDFAGIATHANYDIVYKANNLEEFAKYLSEWKTNGGLTFIWLKIKKGEKEGLGRPKIKPFEVKERLMNILNK